MRTLKIIFVAAAALMLSASSSYAGTITSTIGGIANVDVLVGSNDIVTVDNVIVFGPTEVGGGGAAIEVSFDFAGGSVVGGGGTTNFPTGWFDLSGGNYTCAAGHCENIVAAGDFTGFGAVFPSGSSFALVSIQIDTTGLAEGVYAVGAGLTGPADAIVNPGATDLSGEYTSVGATITVIPEPGTAAMMGLGLGILGLAGRRR